MESLANFFKNNFRILIIVILFTLVSKINRIHIKIFVVSQDA